MPEGPSPLPPPQQADEALVGAHRSGATAAFDEACRRYGPRLVMWLTARVGDQHTAEDLAQDALLRAYQRLHTFDVSRPLWPWLKAIARNLAIDHLRSAQRRQVPTADDVLIAAGEAGPTLDAAETIAERDVLAGAMAGLSPTQRAVVGLRYLHDWTVADVARLLGVTPNTAAQRLVRARGRLRTGYRKLNGEGLGGLAWPLLWPYYVVRDRLTRAREAVSGLAPGPALVSVEALAATAAVTVLTMGQGFGPAPAETGPPAVVVIPSPDRIAGAPADVAAAPPDLAPAAEPAVETEPAPVIAPQSDDGVQLTTSPVPQTRVDARSEVDTDRERTLVLLETRRHTPRLGEPHGGRILVELACDGSVRAKACEAGEGLLDG